jgi:SpoVK/Ycf46/Vps4 family AAA+-type ATPase
MRDDSSELGELKRVVNVLIQNIDEFNSNSILVAATNHPQLLDNAIWRRFDEILKFDLPDKNERRQIFQIHTRKIPLEKMDIEKIINKTKYFSGDDIQKMVRYAVRCVIQQNRDHLRLEDFNEAIKIIRSRKSNEKDITYFINPTTKSELAKSYRKNGLTYEKIADIMKVSVSSAHRLVNK